MKLLSKMLLSAVIVLAGITGCTLEGNGSGVGTGMVIGKLYEPDGITPARGAVVVVHHKNATATIMSSGAPKITGALYTTQTNRSGYFEINTLAEGEYVIEGSDHHGNMARFDSIVIGDETDKIGLLSDTLEPSGTLSGKIDLTAGGNYLQVFVLAFGIDRFCQVSTDGTFMFEGFAEGVYRIKIISLDPDYLSFDTTGVLIGSGDTADLGTISLTAKDRLPVPRNLTAVYDTATMRVDLSWEETSSDLTKGFNVYRLATDKAGEVTFSNGTIALDTPKVHCNSHLIKGTAFSDSSLYGAFSDNTIGYAIEYVVCMVDTNGNESARSSPVTVSIVNNWVAVDSYTIPQIDSATHVADFCGDMKNNLWIACDNGMLLCFGSNGEHKSTVQFGTPLEGQSIFDLLPSCDNEGGTGMLIRCFSQESRSEIRICFYVDPNGDTTRMFTWETDTSGLPQELEPSFVARGKMFGSLTENSFGMRTLADSSITVMYENQDASRYLSGVVLAAGGGFAVVMEETGAGGDQMEAVVVLVDDQSLSVKRQFPAVPWPADPLDFISASDSSLFFTKYCMQILSDGTVLKCMPPLYRIENMRGITVRQDGAIVTLSGFGSDMLTVKLFTER